MGVLHGFDCVFRCKSSHHQGQFAIGSGLDRKPVDSQYVLRNVSTAAIHFHNKLDIFHDSFLFLIDLTRNETTNKDRLGLGVGKIPSGPVVSIFQLPNDHEGTVLRLGLTQRI